MGETGIPDALDLKKRRAAAISLSYNSCLTVLKIVAAAITGSISLLSESVHSATDVVASLLAFLSVRAASIPPDEDHPYGHGKIEGLAGLGESAMLLLITIYIVSEAIGRLFGKASIHHVNTGIVVMALSAAANLVVGRVVLGVGTKTGSLALKSNGRHILIDFVTSLGVLLALLVTRATGWEKADAVFAILFAGWIAYGGFRTVREAIDQLIDRRLPEADIQTICDILSSEPGLISYHRLRSRMSGAVRYADVHVVVPNDWSVVQAHDLADRLEKKIAHSIRPAQVFIHVDPFDPTKTR